MNNIEKLTANEIRRYFGTHKVHYDISSFGKLVTVELTYQDFHPIPEVREWLNNHIPYLWSLHVERTYSRKIEKRAEREIVTRDPNIQFRIEELLFSKDFC